MTREIKFRAWDKKRKRMYQISSLHMADPMNGGIWATVIGKDVIEDKNIKLQIQPKDIEVIEFTGLKDKNGKEIYEGDILKYKTQHPQQKTWLERIIVIEDIRKQIVGSEYSEIIGNVYKNPELLKKIK